MQRPFTLLVAATVAILCLAKGVHGAAAADKRSQAIALYNAGDYRGAAQLLDEYFSANNRDPYAAYYAALAHQQSGNSAKACLYYRQVYALAPSSQVGGYAKNILLKLDPSFAANLPRPAAGGTAIPSTEAGLARAIVDLPASDEVPPLDPSLPSECRIPFKNSRQGVSLDSYINGRPISMTFDTGAPNVVLGKNHLQELGIAAPTGKPDGATGGSASAVPVSFWMMPATVKVGPIERRNMQVMVLENDHSSPLLGQTFFKNFDYTIDGNSGQINFRQKAVSAKQSLSGAAISVPFTFKESANRVMVEVEVNGKPTTMIFDTGNTANACSFMSEAQANKAGVQVPPEARFSQHIGVNGTGTCKIFTVRRLRLGPIDRSDVYVSVNLDTRDSTSIEAPLLGQPFWEGFEYTIDMKKKLIHFVRR